MLNDMKRAVFLMMLMVLTAVASALVQPVSTEGAVSPDLDELLPEEIANWRRMPLGEAVLPAETNLKAGEAVAYRAYRDDLGRVITLVVAYGPPLGDSVRLHRPERCYTAQGFTINKRELSSIAIQSGQMPVIHMLTQNPARREAVSYWLRSGPEFVTTAPSNQLINLRRGLAKPLDGALIRVSSKGSDAQLLTVHEEFLSAFAQSLSKEASALFLGTSQNAASES